MRDECEERVLRSLKRPHEPCFPSVVKRPKFGPVDIESDTRNGHPPDTKDVDFFKSRDGEGAWRRSETIVEFLRRLPVGDPSTVTRDGWLWVGAPKVPHHHAQRMQERNTAAFVLKGTSLLEGFESLVASIKRDNAGKAQSTVTRKITPSRALLSKGLLSCAINTKTTSGKWMLFPDAEDLPRYWRQVATATAEGRLGPMAKVATYQPGKSVTLICIYTYDFSDMVDVRRVLDELVELELCTSCARPIYYKCDAYTHLRIENSNVWGLRASLFSSKEVLENEAKVFQDGPLEELKAKRNLIVDEFLEDSRYDID